MDKFEKKRTNKRTEEMRTCSKNNWYDWYDWRC